ncbi:Ig-like domain-containing protein [Pleionea sediminis]|uniref:Ig-like domain-containing protein n=1 Tax=Pleionea sediminis TaxID=2569479 RepID=UPI0013DE6E1B|nr:Ig-like domain-containing protein [Pleionea sediminis]
MRTINLVVLSFITFISFQTKASDHCEIYPLTVSQTLLENATLGQEFSEVPNGTGPGNYSWLTWNGSNDVVTLSESLVPPGNVETYINPDDTSDTFLSVSDFVQGRPGVMNSRQVRDRLDALLGQAIIVPVWSSNRGQGSLFDYEVATFASIELIDYRLNGQGWISFTYLGINDCSPEGNEAPTVEDITINGTTDSPVTFNVSALDADGDELTYSVIDSPTNGTLTGSGPEYTYTPNSGFIGTDSFTFIANDGEVDSQLATVTLNVSQALCELYPITVAQTFFTNAETGDQFSEIPTGTGPGNYSWLTWDGANDAVSLAESLVPPGNSDNYINPDNSSDTELSIGDFVQGRPGVKNSRAIRDNLDALIGVPIDIPVWSSNRGQGSNFDYQVSEFATIQLIDYRLNGQGWLSFEFLRMGSCTLDDNSPPVALDLETQAAEDTQLSLTVIATDADDDPLTYRIVTPPENGTLTGDGPDYIYTPNPGFSGTDTFTFVANDGQVDSNTATATIEVIPDANQPPVAESLTVSTLIDTSIDLEVEASDPDGDPLTYIIVEQPENGTITGSGPEFVYTPDEGFTGIDTFSFVANDGQDDSNIATGTIQVKEFNTPPVAQNRRVSMLENETLNIFVEAGDVDGDPLTYEIVTPPAEGTVTGEGPNYVYTPNPDFSGIDTFSFVANDGQNDSNIATVIIDVIPVNNPPVAQDIIAEGQEDSPLDVLVVATDEDGDPLTYVIVTEPENGTLTGDGPNYVYTPDPGFTGTDTFEFIASDGQDNSNVATATLEIIEVNNPPVAEDLFVNGPEDTSVDINVVATDEDGDPLTYIIVTEPENGTLTGDGPNYVYTPDPGFTGIDTFEFIASDGEDNSNVATATVEINAGNNPPIAQSSLVEGQEDTPLNITVNATDADGDSLTYQVISGPENGTLTGDGPNFVYTPNLNFSGSDSFTFIANDGQADSNTATITINVADLNSPPVAEDLVFEGLEDTPLDVTVVASDSDNDPLTYIIVTQPENGTLTGDGPNYIYTPDPGFVGTDSFEFIASDGQDNSNVATATIEVLEVNVAPIAQNDSFEVDVNSSFFINLTATDGDGDPLTYTIVSQPNGSLFGSGNGYFYTPPFNFTGTDTFTFKVNDGLVDSNIATITINVIELNEAPVAQDATFDVVVDTPKDITVVATDGDNDSLTYSITSQPSQGVLTGVGPNYVYTPNSGFSGTDSFSFKANDGQVDSNIATVTLNVAPFENTPPVVEDDQFIGFQDTPLEFTVRYSDADGDPLTFSIVGGPFFGTISGDGPTYIYTPGPGFFGTDLIEVQANDGTDNSNVAEIFINIRGNEFQSNQYLIKRQDF